MTTTLSFPDGFAWGTASASYQIEGAVSEDGRTPSIWDTFSHTPGAVLDGDTGDVACDHYHRWKEDLDLMVELGIPSYRFSVSWSRVLPDGRGRVNHSGLDFYKRLVDGLRERNIAPLMTLYHWDLPQGLEDAGGWLDRSVVDAFEEYAVLLGEELGDRVAGIGTMNEPWCAAFLGYAAGVHAPGHHGNANGFRAAHHLNLAHGRAVTALRRVVPADTELSVTLNLHHTRPASDSEADVAAARHVDIVANRVFLDPMLRGEYPEELFRDTAHITDWSFVQDGDIAGVHAPVDLLGLNYYTPAYVAAVTDDTDPRSLWTGTDRARTVDVEGPRTAMGWLIEPRAFTDLLLRVKRDYDVPVVITENGCAADDVVTPDGRVHDAVRIDYLRDHLTAVHRAIERGANVRGYYVWTLLDNFEWAWGYSKRFGIVHVDYETQVRTPKDSAAWFGDVIRRSAIEADDTTP
jgi:beta-glucosidase